MQECEMSQVPSDETQPQAPLADTGNTIGVLRRREIEARIVAPLIAAMGDGFGREAVAQVARETIIRIARAQGGSWPSGWEVPIWPLLSARLTPGRRTMRCGSRWSSALPTSSALMSRAVAMRSCIGRWVFRNSAHS